MVKSKNFLTLFISISCIFTLGWSAEVTNDRKDYIVYLGSNTDESSVSSQQINILQQALESGSAEETLIRSYKRSFNGFAAKLTEKEYENLKSNDEVVSVFPSRTLQLHTTRSWDFLGLPPPNRKQQLAESNVIIGVIDTGIWPESLSFNDDGLSPVPDKWKGGCYGGRNFTCNKKIIGARGYVGTARDDEGHGSHTASAAAGRIVEDTSFYGIAKGSARGGVPSARIAVYKVCKINNDGTTGCNEADVLAAFDDAIADGVDVITISLGGEPAQLYEDSIAIGAFHAMQNGVLTVHSAGNTGSVSPTGSVAPWVLSVAASSTDRSIIDKVVLGNGKILIGSSVNAFTSRGKEFPLVYGKGASRECSEASAKFCSEDCLDEHLLKGKILVCDSASMYQDRSSPYDVAFRGRSNGVLAMSSSSVKNVPLVYPLPAASLNTSDFEALRSYIKSTKAPKAKILKSEVSNDTTAPVIASFSSRGPNSIVPDILKPDISAPGVNILAAFSPDAPISEYRSDKRSVKYNVLSGTSMACPHVAGAAAYVKSLHPDWSPAAIKSSLMTTADSMSSSKDPDAEFAYGSGHLNPIKATNPGLVYDATQKDYITFLCNSGFDEKRIKIFSGNTNRVVCPKKHDQSPNDVNYPSMAAMVDAEKRFTVKFSREVTNVGVVNSTYTANITSGPEIRVSVKPRSLSFRSLKESQSFKVTVVGKGLSYDARLASASLVWSDGIHTVRSPIVVYNIMS